MRGGGGLENQIKKNETEKLCLRYLYLNYKEMHHKNVFCIEDYISLKSKSHFDTLEVNLSKESILTRFQLYLLLSK